MPLRTPLNLLRRIKSSAYHDLRNQLVEAIAFLHEHSVAHCDLKPDNIVVERALEPHGNLSVIDFGNARHCPSGYQCEGFQGTRGWTTPEDADGNKWDPMSADIWATANILVA